MLRKKKHNSTYEAKNQNRAHRAFTLTFKAT